MDMNSGRRAEQAQKTGRAFRKQQAYWYQARVATGNLLAALEKAGAPHELVDCWADQSWMPYWIPHGSVKFLWHLAPEQERLADGDDFAASARALAAKLGTLAAPEDTVLVALEAHRTGVLMSRQAAQDHATEILTPGPAGSFGGEVWVADPSAGWIITIEYGWSNFYRRPDNPGETPAVD